MKKLLFITMCLLLMARFAVAMPYIDDEDYTTPDEKSPPAKSAINKCAYYGFELEWKDCKDCHIPENKMAQRESRPGLAYAHAPANTRIVGNQAIFKLVEINDIYVANFLEYVSYHPELTSIKFEIHSPGGSLMDAKRIIGLIQDFKNRTGHVVTTTVYGFAASAGFYIWLVGDRREATSQATFMWHELWIGKWLSLETPTSSEQEAVILRGLQDTVQEWIAARCSLTKDELDEKVRNAEYWLNGTQAHELGFATVLLPE